MHSHARCGDRRDRRAATRCTTSLSARPPPLPASPTPALARVGGPFTRFDGTCTSSARSVPGPRATCTTGPAPSGNGDPSPNASRAAVSSSSGAPAQPHTAAMAASPSGPVAPSNRAAARRVSTPDTVRARRIHRHLPNARAAESHPGSRRIVIQGPEGELRTNPAPRLSTFCTSTFSCRAAARAERATARRPRPHAAHLASEARP
jgi:hypothetical protein